MSEAEELSKALSAAMEEQAFPAGFRESYIQMERLASGRGTDTYLVRDKNTQTLSIAKYYDKTLLGSVRESEILRSLKHDALPAWRASFEDEYGVCVVREYIEGTPLDQYAQSSPLAPAQSAALCCQLCDILAYLHGQKPPIIHRDLKPSNVIVRPDGRVALIDFDVARTYQPDAKADTVFLGTREYAPPEQYGFKQADGRTDIYALGVMLRWLICGTTDEKEARIANRRLARVIRRATRWSPSERYPSALAMKRALARCIDPRMSTAQRLLAALLAFALTLCAGFALGRYTGILPTLSPTASVAPALFQEPLLERAARANLGLVDDEPLTAEALAGVRGLYIFGNEVAATRDTLDDKLTEERSRLPRGSVMSLADLLLIPNVEEIVLCYQDLEDITGVSAATRLRALELKHTRVKDVSALSGMLTLEHLCLYDCSITDATALDGCLKLSGLDVSNTLIHSPQAVGGTRSLEHLSLKNLRIDSLEGIEAFVHVKELELQSTSVNDLRPVLAMPALRKVYLTEDMRKLAAPLEEQGIEVVYQ